MYYYCLCKSFNELFHIADGQLCSRKRMQNYTLFHFPQNNSQENIHFNLLFNTYKRFKDLENTHTPYIYSRTLANRTIFLSIRRIKYEVILIPFSISAARTCVFLYIRPPVSSNIILNSKRANHRCGLIPNCQIKGKSTNKICRARPS